MHLISFAQNTSEGASSVQDYFTKDYVEPVEPRILFKQPLLLTHPNIPKPLHNLAPRTLMGTKEWNRLRRKAYAKNNYHCFACGIYAEYDLDKQRFKELKLHAHESYDIDYDKCEMQLEYIVALCPTCHDYIHSGRMNALYDKGVLDEQDCWGIRTHGDAVLSSVEESVVDKVDSTCYISTWKKWCLILDGKKYFSKFKNFKEWEEYYK